MPPKCRLHLLPIVLLFALPAFAQTPWPPNLNSPPGRPVSWKLLVPNLLQDQKQIWLFPVRLAQGQHVVPTAAFVGITGSLIAFADAPTARYIRDNQSTWSGFNNVFSSWHTTIGMIAVPSALYAYGLARKSSYDQQSFLLTGEAVVDSDILTVIAKDIDRRLLPKQVPTDGDFNDTWFKGHGQWFTGTGSFPGGHTIIAFSIATVLADRYPKPAWHKWLAYGLAGLVGFSRVPLQSHYVADDFAGAALGYTIAHYVVLRMPVKKRCHHRGTESTGLF